MPRVDEIHGIALMGVAQKALLHTFDILDPLFCACGRRMAASGQRRQNEKDNVPRHFRCNTVGRELAEGACTNARSIRLDLAENLVWGYIEQLILNPRSLLEEVELRRSLSRERNQMIQDRIQMIGGELESIGQKQRLLLDLFLVGHLSKSEFTEKKIELARQRDTLERERGEKEGWLQEDEISAATVEEVQAFCERMAQGLERATVLEKRNILKILQVKVMFDGSSLTIGGGVPVQKLFTSSLPQCQK